MAPNVDNKEYIKIFEKYGYDALGSITGSNGQPYGKMAQYGADSIRVWTDDGYTKGQKWQATVNACTKIGQLLISASNESSEAESAITAGTNNVENYENARKISADRHQEQINKIIEEISNNAKLIEEKLAKIDESNKQKEDMQKQLEEAQKTIEDNREAASKGDKTALDAITGARETIDNLTSMIKQLSQTIAAVSEEVVDIQQTNIELDEQSTDVINDGRLEQENYIQQIAIQQKENLEQETMATKNAEKAIALEAEAVALETSGTISGMFTYGLATAAADIEAERLHTAAADNAKAATIRTSGVAKIATLIGTTLTNINGNIREYSSDYPNYIGSATNESNSVCYDFFDSYNALGSCLEKALTDLQTESDNIGASVEAAYAQLAQNEDDENNKQKKDIEIYVPDLDNCLG